MKLVHTIIPLLALLIAMAPCSAPAYAQTSDEALREVSQAFVTADARRLARFSSNTMNLGLFGATKPYSNRQATLLMRAFFRDNPPEAFTIVDFTKTGRGWFIEASYTVKGRTAPLTVYLRLRLDKSGWLVKEVVIEEERE